jgi:hypothetical protein
MSSGDSLEYWQTNTSFESGLVPDSWLPLLSTREAFRDYHISPDIVGGVDLRYSELFKRLYNTPEGIHLGGQALRFSVHFGYEPGIMAAELGPDVRPLEHNVTTYVHTANLVQAQRQSPWLHQPDKRESTIALIASGLHDMGESMHPDLIIETEPILGKGKGAVLGDIPYGEKSDSDRVVEAAVRQVIWQKYLGILPPEIVTRVEAVIGHTEDTEAHEIYEVGHAIGAYRTGIAAGVIALKETIMEEFLPRLPGSNLYARTGPLLNLAHKVTLGMGAFLRPHAEKYAAVRGTLEKCADVQYAVDKMSGADVKEGYEEVIVPTTSWPKKYYEL